MTNRFTLLVTIVAVAVGVFLVFEGVSQEQTTPIASGVPGFLTKGASYNINLADGRYFMGAELQERRASNGWVEISYERTGSITQPRGVDRRDRHGMAPRIWINIAQVTSVEELAKKKRGSKAHLDF
jgi:hypothetical protein